MPADVELEREADGACTVWMSEHDPMKRLKGMHGVRIRPGSSLIELRVRLFNRTAITQTFLWWANVAAQVHDQYQSFFPPDVRYEVQPDRRIQAAVAVSAPLRNARLTLLENQQPLLDLTADIEPGKPWQNAECNLRVGVLVGAHGRGHSAG
jgi:hypothetical protein